MGAFASHKITIGDTLEPMNCVLRDKNGNAYDLASYNVQYKMELEDGTVELAATGTGVSVHPSQVFTLDTTNNWITCNAHGFKVDAIWVPSTSGSLSGTGLTADVRYKVVEVDVDWLRVSLKSRGAPITISGAGTGTHEAYQLGSVQMDFASSNVDTAQLQRGWWLLTSGGQTLHVHDGDRWIEHNVVGVGN